MHGRSASLSAPRPPCPARLHPRCLPICGSVRLADTSVCTTYVCIYPHSSRFRPLLGGTCSCPCPYVSIVLALGPHLDLSTDAFSKVSVHESHGTDIPGAPDLGLEGATSLVLLGHRARGPPAASWSVTPSPTPGAGRPAACLPGAFTEPRPSPGELFFFPAANRAESDFLLFGLKNGAWTLLASSYLNFMTRILCEDISPG